MATKPTDLIIEDIAFDFEDYLYRAPIKFGGVALDRVTLLNVTCIARTVAGTAATGFGSMPLGNAWSFPSKNLSYDATLAAMKVMAQRIARVTAEYRAPGHPIDINHNLEPAYLGVAAAVERELRLSEPIPKLCALVAASPFDAALHDAFGKAQRLNCYHTYGPQFMTHDLGYYLGSEFRGEYLDRYLLPAAKRRMPLYHLIGALDPLEDSDIHRRLGDGLPETLSEWICHNGLTHLKIKLDGSDITWDVERVARVDRVTAATQESRGVKEWHYSLDFNERCSRVGYILEFLAKVKERTPGGFERIQYIEQPTARDLHAHPDNRMDEVSHVCPVVIDESLTDLDTLYLAQRLGYTGAALKACKGQTQTLLLAAAAQKENLFLCVQDLTCPGASLIQSAGIAAHIPGVAAIEANARQYCPEANRGWESRFPDFFHITDGTMATGLLTGYGLGAV